MKRIAYLCLFLATAMGGCGRSDPGAEIVPERGQESREPSQVELENRRLAQAVELAKIHAKHGEYEEAEAVLESALADSGATDRRDAFDLLDEVKTALAEQDDTAPEDQPSETDLSDTGQTSGSANGNEEPGNSSESGSETAPQETAAAPVPAPSVPPTASDDRSNRATDPGSTPWPPSEKTPATDAEIRNLEESARRADTAKEALALYESFLKGNTLDDEQRPKVERRMQRWTERAEKGLVRLGRDWVPPQEAKAAAEEADNLIGQAVELVKVRNFQDAGQALEKASRVDPNGIRADFLLGLVNSLPYVGLHNPEAAEEHFREVLQRSPNHIPALNNIALAEVKQREFLAAGNHWRRAVELSPTVPPEIMQNLGRLISEASLGKLPVPESQLGRISNLYAQVTAAGKGESADPDRGWMYMLLIVPREESERERKADQVADDGKRLFPFSGGTGFVVHGDYVITNRHVAVDSRFHVDKTTILDPADPEHERELDAELVAVADELDLALLKCEGLDAPAVPLNPELPKRSSEVLLLGYPHGPSFGKSLKSTMGVVTALPSPDYDNMLMDDNMLMYDAESNGGNSGGPACDRHGNAVAVHAVGTRKSIGDYAGGIPCGDVVPFVREHIPGFQPEPADGPRLEWSAVDEKISPSTVMVTVYTREIPLGLDVAATESGLSHPYFEDRSCTACNGAGYAFCPQKGCHRGKVTVKVRRFKTVRVGRGVRKIPYIRHFKKPCPRCDGRNRVDCPYCN